jgi:flagellin-like hook-associated protein FlgL
MLTQNELTLWAVKNFAEILGEFPYKIKLKDDASGDEEDIEFPNVAEALAENSLLNLQNHKNNMVVTEILLKLAVEILNVKVATLKTQAHAKAHTTALGIKGNTESKDIPCQFNFSGSRLSEVLEAAELPMDYYVADGEAGEASVLELLNQIRATSTVAAEGASTRLEDLEEAMSNIDNLRGGNGSAEDKWEFLAALLSEGLLGRDRGAEPPLYQEIDLNFGGEEDQP